MGIFIIFFRFSSSISNWIWSILILPYMESVVLEILFSSKFFLNLTFLKKSETVSSKLPNYFLLLSGFGHFNYFLFEILYPIALKSYLKWFPIPNQIGFWTKGVEIVWVLWDFYDGKPNRINFFNFLFFEWIPSQEDGSSMLRYQIKRFQNKSNEFLNQIKETAVLTYEFFLRNWLFIIFIILWGQ